MPKLKVDTIELRAQMGRANITQVQLAELSNLHRNTITKILKNETADLETVAALANGLNVALAQLEQPQINPFDILKPEGFPTPQMEASAQYV